MPRFYYHIRQAGAVQTNTEVTELESLERARDEAVRTLGEVALEEFSGGGGQQQLSIEVSDETGQWLLSATMSLTVD